MKHRLNPGHTAPGWFAVLLCTFLATTGTAADEPGPGGDMPPPREIPGITTEDVFPHACVDCHVNDPESGNDYRLSTILGRWNSAVEPEILEIARSVSGPDAEFEGMHPRVPAARMDIPGDCLACHESGEDDSMPLAAFVHKVHLAGGGESVFLRLFRGECTHCHKLDSETGAWRVADGTENP